MVPLVVGIGAIAATAALLASLLGLRSVVSYLLAAYLIAWTEIVAVVFALSAGRWVERWTLLAVLLAVAGGALLAWGLRGRERPPSVAAAVRRQVGALRDPLLALPAAASLLGLGYALLVILTTVPNDGDPLAYELTRAAFWRQEGGILNLETAYVPLDFWPPVAETGATVIMTLSGSDQPTGLAQWFAVPALALATYGVGRRIGLDPRAAFWGAAIVPTFPVVVAQSWSAYTDLVFAAFTVTAVYFAIGALGVELVPLALAVGLALGTKFLGPIFAPLFALVVGVAQPIRRWPQAAAAILAGAAVASLWYVRTQLETGHPVGNEGAGIQSREVAPVVTTFQLLTAEMFDLSGAVGRDAWLYAVAALVLCVTALVASRRVGHVWVIGVVTVLVAATPFLVEAVGRLYARSGLAVGDALGRPDLVDQLRGWRPSTVSDGAFSWFGPIGALVAIGAIVVVVVEVRRRRVSRVALALAAAPLLAIGLVSLAVSYQNHQGRYFVAAFALATVSCGGFAVRRRRVGTAVNVIAAATVLLVLVNSLGKPSGVSVFRGDRGRSVWSMPRWEQQGILRSTPAERDEVMAIRFVEEHVPPDASLGVALAYNSFMFPYFGRELARRLTIVDDGDVAPAHIDWIVSSPGQRLLACPDSWRREHLGSYGWSVWRRTAADACSSTAALGSA